MEYLINSTGIKISIRHNKRSADPVVIIAPGFFQSKETKTFKRLERDLSSSLDVISMDFRGHGKSGGLYTFSAEEADDLKAVIDYARKIYSKVGVLGFSYGGAIAMIEASRNKNIDSLVCVGTPMASEEVEFMWWTLDALKLGLKGLERGAGVRPGNPTLKKINAIDVVSGISPTPILFIHGEKDPTVGVRHSRMMHEKAGAPKEIKLFKQGSHAEEIYRQYPVEFIQTVTQWFRKTLQ